MVVGLQQCQHSYAAGSYTCSFGMISDVKAWRLRQGLCLLVKALPKSGQARVQSLSEVTLCDRCASSPISTDQGDESLTASDYNVLQDKQCCQSVTDFEVQLS